MSLAAPLGFLGLIGLGILLLIYLLKPNYQQKLVSSTFVWKLSLRYKKKKVPISKLRNILILICQILIIIACSFIMTEPFIAAEQETTTEKVAIIDASASMLAGDGTDTRFERAVEQAKELANDVLITRSGVFSLVLAGEQPKVLVQRATATTADDVIKTLDDLLVLDRDGLFGNCTFGKCDIEGAIETAENLVVSNPSADVVLFTGTTYIEDGGVTIVNVAKQSEWNAAILGGKATIEDGFYTYDLEVACYGMSKALTVYGEVRGANGSPDNGAELPTVMLTPQTVLLNADQQSVTVSFKTGGEIDRIFQFESAYFYLAEGSTRISDSFGYDNSFYLYNGNYDSRTLNVLYCSDYPTPYVPASLRSIRDAFRRSRRDVVIKEIRNGVPEVEGYDFYIFEHSSSRDGSSVIPTELPTDGVVMLINPDKVPRGVDIRFGGTETGEFSVIPVSGGHPLSEYVDLEDMLVTRYTRISDYDSSFDQIWVMGSGDPMLLAKNETESKLVIMPFSLNYADIPGLPQMAILFRNIFNYFMPSAIGGTVFSVNETVELRGRGPQFTLAGAGVNETFTTVPGKSEPYKFTRSGSYTVTQTVISGKTIVESFYIQIPPTESNILKEEDIKTQRAGRTVMDVVEDDLAVYFAAVMLFLLAAEWFLHSRELRV